ncbi:hypothetical protein RJT34_13587 [Clitoria ternatea]|uniref:SPRY domain-containing protein n=1 Tax=Clitoria ternatea TaxID=43366 RepID=A0AAN9JRT5_CLITE
MASMKRHFPEEESVSHPHSSKKLKESQSHSSRVHLNHADCNLDFNIEGNGIVGYGLYEQGFAYCWSGARANVGIWRGKYCFGCKVVSAQLVDMNDTAPEQRHVCRVGVSRGDDAVGNLGESKHSFGYGGTAKFSNNGKFLTFGDKFGVGDTIVCCVDLESKPLASICFSKNGKWLGSATQFDAASLGLGVVDSPLQWKSALFPHVLLKNVVVQMQFGVEDGLVPEEGFKPWASAVEDRNMVMGPTFSDPRDCEVMMMVGLPASGKTTWAEKWVHDHPEKRYVLLGTNLILDQMKVPGLLRKNNYGERFDLLMDRATEIFNILLSRASNVPRNYIIDQTNVYKSARKRKLRPFADFQKIAVVVFPKLEELKLRSDKRFREMGKEVPPDAVNNMIANFVLPKSKDMPHSDEFFDQVMFVELNQNETQKYLDQMKHDLATVSNNNSSALSCGGSFATSVSQNIGSSAGCGTHRPGSYSTISPSNYGMPSQVYGNSNVSELRGSVNSFSGVYPSSQIPHVSGVPSPCEPYSNNASSGFPRDIADRSRTYGAIHTGDARTYNNSIVDGPYSPNLTGNNMHLRDAFHDPYRSGMNAAPPIASARTMPFDYVGRPYSYNGVFQPNLQTPSLTAYDSLPPYGTPIPRPPYGSLPDNAPYSRRYTSQRPRYL